MGSTVAAGGGAGVGDAGVGDHDRHGVAQAAAAELAEVLGLSVAVAIAVEVDLASLVEEGRERSLADLVVADLVGCTVVGLRALTAAPGEQDGTCQEENEADQFQ